MVTQIVMCRSCIWDKLFKSGPSKICERQPLKNVKAYGLQHGLLK